METEITRYAYIYIEHTAIGKPYLTHKDLPDEMRKNIGEAFKDAGGVDLITVDEGTEKRVVSVWDSLEGYDKWLRDPRTKPYLEYRDNYNDKNEIRQVLSGPFKHTMKKEHE